MKLPLVFIGTALGLVVCASANAQSVQFRFATPAGSVPYNPADGRFEVAANLEIWNQLSSPLTGFSMSFTYDRDLLRAASAAPTGPLAALDNGLGNTGPAFFLLDLDAGAPGQGGVTLGVAFDVATGDTLALDTATEVVSFTFDSVQPAFLRNTGGESVELTFEALGNPAIDNLAAVDGGDGVVLEVLAETVDAAIVFAPDMPFRYTFTTPAGCVEYSTAAGAATFEVQLGIEELSAGNAAFPRESTGFSLSFEYDADLITATSVSALGDVLALGKSLDGAAFFGASIDPDGVVALGVVYSADATPQTILFDERKEVVEISFDTVAAALEGNEAGADTDLEFAASGNPIIDNLVATEGDVGYLTLTEDASIELVPVIVRQFTFRAVPGPGAGSYDLESGAGAFDLDITIEESPDNDGFPRPTQGFSLGLGHDGAYLRVVSADTIGDVGAVNGGFGPTFEGFNLAPTSPGGGAGWTVGVVYSLMGGVFVEFEGESPVIRAEYETVESAFAGDAAGTTTALEFRDDLGDPAVASLVVVAGESFPPAYVNATVVLAPEVVVPFLRSDCNDDGQLDIADGIYVLNFLFLEGPAAGCLGACDSNADGSLDQSDAIYIFNYQFLDGPPPPAPFPSCAASRTEDEPCAEQSSCTP